MADVEVCEKHVQTSRPPTDRPIDVQSDTQTSAVSDFSCKSSETLSVGKLDSLFTNSMQILVRRVNGGDSKRPSMEIPTVPQPGDPCAIAGCKGTVSQHRSLPSVLNGNRIHSTTNLDNYSDHFERSSSRYDQSTTASRHSSRYGRHSGNSSHQSRQNGRPFDHLNPSGRYSRILSNYSDRSKRNVKDFSSLRLEGISTLSQESTFPGLEFSSPSNGRGTCVDDRKPYKPTKPRPMLTRSKTTIPTTTAASRHCDACSLRDLQDWFTMNPGQMTSPRPPNEINPTRPIREKSQVFLLNKQPKLDSIGENMAEVMLPMATIPKKGLIKLSCLEEDHVNYEDQYRAAKERNRPREPLRPLIKNKKILDEIRETYNELLEKERLETEQARKLLRRESSASSTYLPPV